MTREPVFELVSPGTNTLIAEADDIDQILYAAQEIRAEAAEHGGDSLLDELVVMRGGRYDGTATALVQENLV